MESKNRGAKSLQIGTPLCGLVTAIFAAIVALLLVTIGFWKTLFVVVVFVGGYSFGAHKSKMEKIKAFINQKFPNQGV